MDEQKTFQLTVSKQHTWPQEDIHHNSTTKKKRFRRLPLRRRSLINLQASQLHAVDDQFDDRHILSKTISLVYKSRTTTLGESYVATNQLARAKVSCDKRRRCASMRENAYYDFVRAVFVRAFIIKSALLETGHVSRNQTVCLVSKRYNVLLSSARTL